jgi:HSP20 family molecular chaperone IbpA
MSVTNELTKQLAQLANMNSVIGGGISSMNERIRELKDGVLLEVSMPSVSPDAYKVRIKDNILMVIMSLSVIENIDSEEEKVFSPSLIRAFPIPHFIDVDNIQAQYNYEEGKLQVFAPYNNLRNYAKDVDIKF